MLSLQRGLVSIALNKLFSVYTFDTACFYTDEEAELDHSLQIARKILAKCKKAYQKSCPYNACQKNQVHNLNRIIKETKESLKDTISDNVELVREVRPESLRDRNVVNVFDSNLIRCLGMEENELNDALIIVKVYYFGIAESIIKNGFYLNGEKYVFFSASAGQIRTKKFVAVKESLLNDCWDTLTCGLSVEHINELGGVNKNKYLAYLALCNSATDLWEGFNIDKCIVVEDFETPVNGMVDFIDEKAYTVERKQMDVPVTHTDGCGMILPSLSKKNFMCRAPWVKGLLSPFPFDKFVREANRFEPEVNHGIVTDIYGKQYDILADDIQIIFTKSQFKMWKYYCNWDEYKENFKKFGCSAGKCNEEDDYIGNAKFNYQMLQTLTDLSDDELKAICSQHNSDLKDISSDRKTMLKVFGATKDNEHKNSFQECLYLYPELLQDIYTREVLKDIKKKMEKEGRAGRVGIDGKYLFLIPDLYAFCQRLFLGEENPTGLLDNGEVYCKLYPDKYKLDCLRSPHLYAEHAVRKNVYGSTAYHKRWFVTNGIYTSCHDLISKILQFDNDGDNSLVCADETIIRVAERNCKDLAPLYYKMAKAPAQIISPEALYKGMIDAYTGGNIGSPSNDISKLWNKDNPDLTAIKLLCAEVNFTIDYAKTLYKPVRPPDIDKKLRDIVRGKLPYFFMFAKDKKEGQVEPRNNSCVNRLHDIIQVHKLNFNKKELGTFDYRMLMRDKDFMIDDSCDTVIKRYYKLASSVNFRLSSDGESNNYDYLFSDIRNELLKIEPDIYRLTDILVVQLFKKKKAVHKIVFWNCFGETVLENLRANISPNYIMCERCGKRVPRITYNQKYCSECALIPPPLLGTKTMVCCDCGKEFEVDSKNNRSTRCPSCYKEYRRIYKADNIKQQRLASKLADVDSTN